MIGVQAARLPGDRLHLQHGPIDLVIGAGESRDQERDAAFAAATRRFATVLEELVAELPLLQAPVVVGKMPVGVIARRMVAAVEPHHGCFVTPMAAVAGAVAEEVLKAMIDTVPVRRAYVNNGGDIALHLDTGEGSEDKRFRAEMAGPGGAALGSIEVSADMSVRGIATSGQGGRSLSMGIADSVTVVAVRASDADVAATLIANEVDLPGHRSVVRCSADRLQPDSDLGERPVVTEVGMLEEREIGAALDRGQRRAIAMHAGGLILGAALFLRGQVRLVGHFPVSAAHQRKVEHA